MPKILRTYVLYHDGPFTAQEVENTRERARALNAAARQWAPLLSQAEDPWEPIDTPDFPEALRLVLLAAEEFGYLPADDVLGEVCYMIEDLTTPESVDDMILVLTNITDYRRIEAPDLGHRLIEDRYHVFVAGDRTYGGEEPRGRGYLILKHLLWLGLHKPLGLR